MIRTLRLGSRRSALAQVQAREVGLALQTLDPALRIEYHFIEASGDRSREPDAGLVTARGGFTEDLQQLLDRGAIDLAVHSWKDLPLPERKGSCVAATLPRADPRDVLLLRRDSLAKPSPLSLRILSSSARRRLHLEEFLSWALPVSVASLNFAPIRGDIPRRLQQLLDGAGDGLVVAKAALDRLVNATEPLPSLCAAQQVVRRALDECRALVLPLQYCPAAPAQAALAIEVPDRTPYSSLWRALNDTETFELAAAEREIARSYGDDEPLGVTCLRLPFGDLEYRRGAGDGNAPRPPLLRRRGAGLPRPAAESQLWCGEEPPDIQPQRHSLPSAPRDFAAGEGLLVARSDALPADARVDDHTPIWTPGLATWRALAARGYWVVGSDESLGESGAVAVRTWYPSVRRWIKLTHERGHDNAHGDWLPTYRLDSRRRFADLGRYTHFFWRSGSQLRDYLARFPELARAWHGCGPGNTYQIARTLLPAARLQPFLDPAQFRAELTS